MQTYFSTFIPGFTEVIKSTFKNDFPDAKIEHFFESSVLFKTKKDYAEVTSKLYFNNVFFVFNSLHFDKKKLSGSVVKELYKGFDNDSSIFLTNLLPNSKSFRIMVQKGNKLIHIPREFTKKILSSIIDQTKLIHNPLKADIEFWFLIRDEGLAVLGVKSNKAKANDYQKVHKGELRPEIAHILNLISEPREDDIYLDPFAHSGALPWNRLHYFPYTHIYASDKEKLLVIKLKKRMTDRNVTVKQADALHLDYLNDKSINKIVTDPPWGEYQMQDIDYKKFYTDMLSEIVRVIQDKGIIVILTAKKHEFEAALSNFKYKLTLLKRVNTLVNGKKSSVYKLVAGI